MRLFYFLLVFLLTACGEGQDPNPLYNLENLSIKLTIEPQNNILFEHSLPHRNYENQTEEMPHLSLVLFMMNPETFRKKSCLK